jgi:hypothetical protein
MMLAPIARCLFCGGDRTTADHLTYCSGRQGRLEADFDPRENVRRTDPDTSYLAAHHGKVRGDYRKRQRFNVYLAICQAGSHGATDEENALYLGYRLSSADKRRGELVKVGLVVDSGRRRKTTSGCWAIVWIAVE